MSTYILENKDLPSVSVEIYRQVLHDPRLSLKAKGLHAFMRSMPSGWRFNVPDLTNRLPEGKAAITAALKELVDVGYIDRDRARGEDGVFMGYLYIVCQGCQELLEVETDPIGQEVHQLRLGGLVQQDENASARAREPSGLKVGASAARQEQDACVRPRHAVVVLSIAS